MKYITTENSVSKAPCLKAYCSFKAPTGYCSQSYCVMEETNCVMEETKRKSVQRKSAQGLQYGWVCPKCGAVYGPNVSSCWYCTPQIQITYTD